MSKSVHQFEIRGVDRSAAAFSSVKAKAAVTGQQIRRMVGGALAGAGAYLSFSALKGGIEELSRLSDVAQKSNVSVADLTSTSTALSSLGIGVGVEGFARAMGFLAKNTGRTGMDGFYKTIEEIGKIPDVSQRAEAAMKVFGRSGMEFMPLINAADTGVEALQTVINAMPRVTDAAANAGDGAADAMGFAANSVKSIWLQGLGFLANKLNNDYTGDVRTASLRAGNFLEYYTKKAVATCITWFRKMQASLAAIGQAAGAFVGGTIEKLFGSGGSWSDVWQGTVDAWNQGLTEYEDTAKELEKTEQERTDRWKKDYEDRALAIQKFSRAYAKAAISVDRRKMGGGENAAEGLLRSTKISNDLMMAGSNAALKAQILGPTFQSEQKKQTSILEKIKENTEKTATNTDDLSGENYEVVS